MEAIGVAQVRNNYHRHIHQDMSFLPPQAPPPVEIQQPYSRNLLTGLKRKRLALGAEIILSQAVLANANHDEHAKKLLQEEAEHQLSIDRNEGDVVELNRAINAIRSEMRKCSRLSEIMSLRDGQALNRAQIKLLAQSLGKSVLIVDYVFEHSAFTGLRYQIIPMVYKNGNLVSAQIFGQDLDMESIKLWISTYLQVGDQKPLLESLSGLKDLYPLIDQAIKFSQPGDPIVVCPTDALFRIPLHTFNFPMVSIGFNGTQLSTHRAYPYSVSVKPLRQALNQPVILKYLLSKHFQTEI